MNPIIRMSLLFYSEVCKFLHKYFGPVAETKFIYFARTRKILDLNNPQNLNEKLQWLSLYWKHPLQVFCSDKYTVREYVSEKVGDDVLNELYGVYDKAEEIDYDKLPSSFALKCNFGSGRNYFCKDKSLIDFEDVRKLLNKWMSSNYDDGKEWQYTDIHKKILAEKYLFDYGSEMMEYQVFCFNGEPGFFLVRNDLGEMEEAQDTFAISYSVDWERQYLRKGEEKFTQVVPKPVNYDKMLMYARKLSADFPHVRVDFYEIGDRLIFGELTFSSSGGILSTYKDDVIIDYGKKLKLPNKYE